MSDVEDLPADVNLAWSDPHLQQSVDALARRDAGPALDLLAASADSPHRRELYVDVLGDVARDQTWRLRVLAQEKRLDADRWLLLGSALRAAGWAARGADTADLTSEERFAALVDNTQEARAALHHVAELSPEDAVPWSQLMYCALGAPEYDGEWEKVFAEATRRVPDLFGAHAVRLRTLAGKWYGSQDQVFAFARERTADLPPGHPMLALVAGAHIEGHLDRIMDGNLVTRIWRAVRNRYFADEAVRAEINSASERLLRGADDFADHPWSTVAHQTFAVAHKQTRNVELLRRHLERAGTRPAPWPWGYFGDYRTEFAEARAAAGLN